MYIYAKKMHKICLTFFKKVRQKMRQIFMKMALKPYFMRVSALSHFFQKSETKNETNFVSFGQFIIFLFFVYNFFIFCLIF